MTKKYRYVCKLNLEIGDTVGNYLIVGKVYDEKIKGYNFLVRCNICQTEKIVQRANLRGSSKMCRSCYLSQCKKNRKIEYEIVNPYASFEIEDKDSVFYPNNKYKNKENK